MPHLIPVVRKTLAEQVATQLLSMVNNGVWKVGERLPTEPELCKALHVGRSSLREAIKSLMFIGIIEIRPGEGTFVAGASSGLLGRIVTSGDSSSAVDMADLFEARVIIEPELAALCANRATKDELEKLSDIVKEMEQTLRDIDRFAECDLNFHISVARASHNRSLSRYMEAIAGPLGKLIKKGAQNSNSRLVITHHSKIMDALKHHNPAKARARMLAHLRTFERGYHLIQKASEPEGKASLEVNPSKI